MRFKLLRQWSRCATSFRASGASCNALSTLAPAEQGHGAGDAVERRAGEGIDFQAKRCGSLCLLRRPCTRLSRRSDRVAAPLRSSRKTVPAGHHRLPDQRKCAFNSCAGGCDSVVGDQRAPDAGATAAAGGRSTPNALSTLAPTNCRPDLGGAGPAAIPVIWIGRARPKFNPCPRPGRERSEPKPHRKIVPGTGSSNRADLPRYPMEDSCADTFGWG